MNINIKNLCKQIKKDSTRSLFWTVSGGIHYITNRHWMVKYSVDNLPREVLIQMFYAFAQIPQEGRSLVLFRGNAVEEKPAISCEPIYKTCESFEVSGVLTNIVLNYDEFKCRIIKSNDAIIRIDETYAGMINCEKDKIACGNKLQPISFCDNHFIILPYRTSNDNEDKDIELLLVG